MSKPKDKIFFKEIPQNFDFIKNECDLLTWWYKSDIVKQYLHKNKNSSKTFSFIDGPITANGPMGVHHARGRTYKDLFPRYKNMQGFQQRFQNGFDCQGLWVEVEVEKEIGFNSKKDIINFGLDKFTQTCIARVNKFATIQTEQSKRLGMFMDWDNSYYTMSRDNNLYIWHFLKEINKKGWLYQKKSAATWCPRCETGLSQHEQADGYKDIADTSVYVKFKLENTNNEYVLAWTTTPWTLPINVLLAINTKYQYVKAKMDNDFIYLAKDAADRLGLSNYELIPATNLLNRKFIPLYDIPAQKNINHYICEWDLVDPAEGTGVVHIAPGGGQEDFELGQKLGADIINALDETGHFMSGFGNLDGKYAHDVRDQVIDYLKSIKALYKTEPITHRYPHCWRCKTKCLFRLENSWFINCNEIRPLLKKNALSAKWIPKYIGRRMQNWLDNMEDWMISRKRFYGLALPFYPCECGQLTIVGNLEELKSLATDKSKVDNLKSVHRPWIDEIEIKCPVCGKNVKRIPDVGDCWLDAGVVPFSTLKYLEDKLYWQKWFPADFVCEMTEQVRLWYYSMLFFSTVFENKTPYLHVLNYSEVRDEKGERISKTKHNGIPYDEAVEKMSADAMRWLYCKQKAHMSVNFGYSIADDVKRNFLFIIWNTLKFFSQHANLQNWQPKKLKPSSNILDRWILSRLHETIKLVTKHLDRYSTSPCTETIESFVSDLSTWYVRRSREREDMLETLFICLEKLSLILAPFIPFLSDTIFQHLHPENSKTSVHLQSWPIIDKKAIDINLHQQIQLVRDICQLIHAERQKAQIKIRQPLSFATVKASSVCLPQELLNLIKEETNIKNLNWQKSTKTGTAVELDTKLTPKLIEEGEYRELTRSIQILRKEAKLFPKDKIKILAPNWPASFQADILKKTLAISIDKSDTLKIERVN